MIRIGISDLKGDQFHGVEVGVGGGRETGLNYVDAEASKLAGYVELLFGGHGGAGGLLAVAEGGVEYADVLRVWDLVGDVVRAGNGAADGGRSSGGGISEV